MVSLQMCSIYNPENLKTWAMPLFLTQTPWTSSPTSTTNGPRNRKEKEVWNVNSRSSIIIRNVCLGSFRFYGKKQSWLTWPFHALTPSLICNHSHPTLLVFSYFTQLSSLLFFNQFKVFNYINMLLSINLRPPTI